MSKIDPVLSISKESFPYPYKLSEAHVITNSKAGEKTKWIKSYTGNERALFTSRKCYGFAKFKINESLTKFFEDTRT